MTLYELVAGTTYEVIADVAHYGGVVSKGERLTFRERNFVPYHGGHTVTFDETKLYFQEDEHQTMIEHLDRYLRPVSV